jgi:hypothetical protein
MNDYEVRQTQLFARIDRISDDLRDIDTQKGLKTEIQNSIAVMLPKFEQSVRERLDKIERE